MPQLVKGGKYVFGWSKVHPRGKIIIPPEAFEEYGFLAGEKVISMSGSKTSGGFGVTSLRLLEGSPLSSFIEELPRLSEFRMEEGTPVVHNERIFSWEDQIRLCDSLLAAKARGAKIILCNADNKSVKKLYKGIGKIFRLKRQSRLAADPLKRQNTTELAILNTTH